MVRKSTKPKIKKKALTGRRGRKRAPGRKTYVSYEEAGTAINGIKIPKKLQPASEGDMDFEPIEISGEPLSATILRERR